MIKINDLDGKYGAPGTIRTSDPQIRSLMLYPAELRARLAANGEGGYLAEAGAGGKGCRAGFRSCHPARPGRYETAGVSFSRVAGQGAVTSRFCLLRMSPP